VYSSQPRLELKDKIILLVVGSVGVFAFAWFAYFLYLDSVCPAHMTKCLPESVFIRPVTETPEGKAFLAKYPDPQFYVDQTCLEERIFPCSVDIVHNLNSSVPEGARVTLVTQVNVSSFSNPNPSIGGKRLSCVGLVDGQLDVWTVRGDIMQNLQPKTPDCWDTGPPPPPSDNDLIQRAQNTTVAKAYLDRYSDNSVSVKRNGTTSNMPEVTFTPRTSEPIRLVVYFQGLDWEIPFIAIACSNGNQTWYHYWPDEADFWSYLQPEQGDCWDHPPPE
jgi:hypothetical protein